MDWKLPAYPEIGLFQLSLINEVVLSGIEPIETVSAGWTIESIRESGGDKGIVIMPESGDDADGPTLVVWLLETSFRLDEVRWDAYETVLVTDSVAKVLGEIRGRVSEAAEWPRGKS
jgi:hypothetical protein